MPEKRPTATAGCRLTPDEKMLLEAAATRDGERFVSRYLRGIIQDHLRERFGPQVLPHVGQDGEAASG